MINNLKLTQKGLILVSIPLIFQILFIAVLSYLLSEAEDEARIAEVSKSVIYEVETIDKLFYEAGLSLIAYKRTNTPERLKRYQELCYEIAGATATVGNLIKSQPEQKSVFEPLQSGVDKGLILFHSVKEGIESGNMSEEMVLDQTILLSSKLQDAMDKVFAIEQKRAAFAPHVEARLKKYIEYVLLGSVVFNVVLAVSLAILFNQATSRRLKVVLENLKRFSKGESLLPLLSGRDEIVALDVAFHFMALALDEARNKQRAIIENVHDVICGLDSSLILKTVNFAASENWGYSPEEIAGTNILNICPENNRKELDKNLSEIVRTKSAGRFESKLMHKSGRIIDAWWSVRWYEAEQSMFCVIQDNRERKESERIKQEIMKMVSHDLRSPLTSIQFSLDILGSGARGRISPEGLRDIAVAKKNVNQLMKLINYLLDIEKLASGTLKLHLEQISVDFLVNRVIESLHSWAQDRNIELNYSHSGLFVVGDSELLTQVLINFVSNAIKFSPENSQIDIVALVEDSMLIMKVIDHGPGIPQEKLAEILNHFFS